MGDLESSFSRVEYTRIHSDTIFERAYSLDLSNVNYNTTAEAIVSLKNRASQNSSRKMKNGNLKAEVERVHWLKLLDERGQETEKPDEVYSAVIRLRITYYDIDAKDTIQASAIMEHATNRNGSLQEFIDLLSRVHHIPYSVEEKPKPAPAAVQPFPAQQQGQTQQVLVPVPSQ